MSNLEDREKYKYGSFFYKRTKRGHETFIKVINANKNT